MAALQGVFVFLNCLVLINSAVMNRGVLRRLLNSYTNVCPKIVEKETEEVLQYSLCPSEISVDMDESRIPQRIQEVSCIQNPETCNYCHESHRCVQLQTTMYVYYLKSEKSNEVIPQSQPVTYNSGCVCANLPTKTAGAIVTDIVA